MLVLIGVVELVKMLVLLVVVMSGEKRVSVLRCYFR